MDKFYIKDNKIYVENDVELIELTLEELLEETNRLAKKDVMMEEALELTSSLITYFIGTRDIGEVVDMAQISYSVNILKQDNTNIINYFKHKAHEVLENEHRNI